MLISFWRFSFSDRVFIVQYPIRTLCGRSKLCVFFFGTPEIESFVREGVGRENDPRSKKGPDLGSLIYVVIFRYDKTKESMDWDYAAKVYISDKGGMAYAIALGNGIIFKFYEMKKNPIE